MRPHRLLSLAMITFVLALGHVSQASACSCIPLAPEAFEDSDAAVIAELVDVRPDGPAGEGPAGDALFRYEVRRALKGQRRIDHDRITIRSSLSSAACGLPQERDRYGLLLGREGGRWTASRCSVTTPKAIRALARGEQPARSRCARDRRR